MPASYICSQLANLSACLSSDAWAVRRNRYVLVLLLAAVVGLATTYCVLLCCLPEEMEEMMGSKKTEKQDAKAE